MLAFTATLAALLALIVVTLLAVPVVLVIDARRLDTLQAVWRVRWFFGLVDVRSGRRGSPQPSRTGAEARPARAPARDGTGRARMALAVLRTRGLLRRVQRLALSLLRRARLEEFRLHMAFGFDNPADTGIVYGFLSPLLVLAEMRGLDVECRPMFPEAGLRGVFNATVSVRPLSVVGALVAFVLSPPVMRAARSAWRARR
ncbi:MAG TPA: DUF2953 domain-containing protein [Vicinamibacterales bacterium]|nr:DUF2953 domain-containing protein [Vicinamibacterales bacterium]